MSTTSPAQRVQEQTTEDVQRLLRELELALTALWHGKREMAEAATLAVVNRLQHFHLRALAYYKE